MDSTSVWDLAVTYQGHLVGPSVASQFIVINVIIINKNGHSVKIAWVISGRVSWLAVKHIY